MNSIKNIIIIITYVADKLYLKKQKFKKVNSDSPNYGKITKQFDEKCGTQTIKTRLILQFFWCCYLFFYLHWTKI